MPGCTKIAFAINKGGTAKTTTAATLGHLFGRAGLSVLLVDLDPQGSLTRMFLKDDEMPQKTLLEAFNKPGTECRVRLDERIDLMPSSPGMITLEQDLTTRTSREKILKKILNRAGAEESYDYVLIDCPPALGIVTTNALAVCDRLYVPVSADFLGIDGLKRLQDYCEALAEDEDFGNQGLKIDGVIVTRFDNRIKSCSDMEQALRAVYGDAVLRTVIHSNSKVADAPRALKTVVEYAPSSTGARDYIKLATEILERESH